MTKSGIIDECLPGALYTILVEFKKTQGLNHFVEGIGVLYF